MTAATETKRPEILPPLEEDYELLKTAVREAGALANGYFKQELEVHKKPDGSEVSEADLAVGNSAARPSDGHLQGL